ncbi:hypothetical protein BS47DRAFT_1482110 [Hydnum rufescens UP504]|uniref:Uncharacterized protein n=1 Tax=Hydnum rufescens UP504 TaxID=1448309 RepID=A0A9P6B814_9AGAM|nr:hypothetical protein BS47DRAFT_1482110 [Hydnum rufescens UP504]
MEIRLLMAYRLCATPRLLVAVNASTGTLSIAVSSRWLITTVSWTICPRCPRLRWHADLASQLDQGMQSTALRHNGFCLSPERSDGDEYQHTVLGMCAASGSARAVAAIRSGSGFSLLTRTSRQRLMLTSC